MYQITIKGGLDYYARTPDEARKMAEKYDLGRGFTIRFIGE